MIMRYSAASGGVIRRVVRRLGVFFEVFVFRRDSSDDILLDSCREESSDELFGEWEYFLSFLFFEETRQMTYYWIRVGRSHQTSCSEIGSIF
jgi:hypothetical protein